MIRLLPFALLWACSGGTKDTAGDANPPRALASDAVLEHLDWRRVKQTVDFLADESLGGRISNTTGHQEAADYLVEALRDIGAQPLGSDGYVYAYDDIASPDRFMIDDDGAVVPHVGGTGHNLIGVIAGSDPVLADEYVVLTAHYDHLGVDETGDAYNGAFDNAAAVGVLLELGRAWIDLGEAPPRSVILMLTDDEENAQQASYAWLEEPTVPFESIVANINVDSIGRGWMPDNWPLLIAGAERTPALQQVVRGSADLWTGEPSADHHLMQVPRHFIPIFNSDHDAFLAEEPAIPALWFVSAGMYHYHTVNDTADTIDYRNVVDCGRFLAHLVTQIASMQTAPTTVPEQGLLVSDVVLLDETIGLLLQSEHLPAVHVALFEGLQQNARDAIAADDVDELGDIDSYSETLMVTFVGASQWVEGPIPPPEPAE
jgi:hypothetical protein